ncbi:MAG: phosphoribosyltransferase [Planctomycetes bacterium]|nr:phosphoribosyltransferase [Planctomycetota bacterium]MBU4398934.1 phosphoribosyltransferase [Planctomycetota bacterium]MCG2683211.1 phosphoribosyltransferase [Planctomycetales bacterium]
MIPKIIHSRSQLHCHLNEYEEGAHSLFVSANTYPEIFDLLCSDITKKSPKGWRKSSGGKMCYLWFPSDALDDDDLADINDWKEHFKQYVLIGLNDNISDYFKDELDFCMALDFNFLDTQANKRTYFGVAVYQLKYKQSLPGMIVLQAALQEAINYLPLHAETRTTLVLTNVPCDPGACNVPCKLASEIANKMNLAYIRADLLCDKSALKRISLDRKIPEWQELYECPGCIVLNGNVRDKTVLIIDDLYQSGATMWCYAKYLKKCGAKHVLGLPCVKTLRDTDNQ